MSPDLEEPFRAYWTVRVIDASGTQVVDDCDEAPQAVIFHGTNWTTLDSLVIPAAEPATGMGVFRGMVSKKPDGSTWQAATSVLPAGDAHRGEEGAAILMATGSGGIDYRAVVTLTDNGFSAAFSAGHSGCKVVCLILFGAANCVAVRETGGNETHTIGFRARAHLSQGGWAFPISGSDRTQEFYGGGQFMSASELDYNGGGMTVCSFPTSASQQALSELNLWHLSNGMFETTQHFTGPFLISANVHLKPVTPSTSETQIQTSFDEGGGISVVWDGWSELGYGSHVQSAGGTWTVTGLGFRPAALVGYSISDEWVGQQGDGTVYGAAGFAVVCDDGPLAYALDPEADGEQFQWCALVDGRGAGAFQSFERGFVDAVNGSGYHAGQIEFTDDGFTMTTRDDAITKQAWVWHALGIPQPLVPTIYRHGVRYR